MEQEDQSRKKYPSDLTDEPWAIVEPLIPPAKQHTQGGRPRTVDMREVLQTLCSLHRSGGPWEMWPHAVLPTRTVSDDVAQWRDDGTWAKMIKALRERTRVEAGRDPTPSAACLERPSVKTPESRDLLRPVFLTRSGGMQMEAGELSEAEVELEVVEPWDTRVNMFGA